MKRHGFYNIFPIVLMTLVMSILSSCTDDPLMEPVQIIDGESTVGMTVSFYPDVENSVGSSRAAGNSLETLRTLSVVIFDIEGNFVDLVPMDRLLDYKGGTHTDRPAMSPEDAENGGTWTEGSQEQATFRIENIKNGRYHMYCIANMTVDESDVKLNDSDTEYKTDEDKMRHITVRWIEDNIAANDQMFGYFTAADNKSTDQPMAEAGLQAPEVLVNGPNTRLHCWLKRCASKVTVAFDPTGLHQNVNIYIHKVTIKDIPISCTIGYDNSPECELANRTDQLILDGESYYYDTEGNLTKTNPGDGKDNISKWLHLDNSMGVKGSKHLATDDALFFYENMQGDYKDEPENIRERYNKEPKAGWVHEYLNRPEADKDKRPWDYDTKDKIAAGTYIEVEAYYDSRNENNVTNGPIIYRFMLGKNTTYNYNAQRNHHYKLTLAFKGYANQPEWHIEYVEEKPSLHIPPVFYMPYVYNQRVEMPVRWIGEIESLYFEILGNDWGPYEWDYTKPISTGRWGVSGNDADFSWNVDSWNSHNGVSSDSTTYGKNKQFLGFLGLTLPKEPHADVLANYAYSAGETAQQMLKQDYEGPARGRARQDRRTLTAEQLQAKEYDPEWKDTDQANHYTVTEESGSHTLMLPLFTRSKSMINASGFSGNNPYEYFYRRAKLKVTAKFKNGTEISGISFIMQVPRLTNPKGVWRDLGQTQDFNVTLMTRKGSSRSSDFIPFNSDGSWSAEIESGNKSGNFTITPGPDAKSDPESAGYSQKIIGKTNTKIVFTIGFGGNAECAVIKVMYNAEKCVHRIYVRQGYGPIRVEGGEDDPRVIPQANIATWSSFNLKHGGDGTINTSVSNGAVLVNNPLSFGSYFKRKNLNQGILEKNNDTWGHTVSINGKQLELSNGNTGTWRSINSKWIRNTSTMTDDITWQDINVTGKGAYQLPTYEQFKSLTDNSDFGFGIFYTDDATEPQTVYTRATGYATEWNPNTSTYGMRGICVYNRHNAHQLFFPMSKAGHGRRIQAFMSGATNRGYLLYGDVSGTLNNDRNSNNQYRPIPYGLGYTAGALYWLRQIKANGHVEGSASGATLYYPCAAWDMNYFNFDFGPYTANCLYKHSSTTTEDTGSDALPIRLIKK